MVSALVFSRFPFPSCPDSGAPQCRWLLQLPRTAHRAPPDSPSSSQPQRAGRASGSRASSHRFQFRCTAHPTAHNFGLRYYISDTDFRFDICVNLINIAKEYKGQINYLTVTIPDKPQLNYYGDIGCKEGVKCLKTLTIDDIYQMCKVQNKETQSSYFSFSWF